MFSLIALVVHPKHKIWCTSTFDPFNQTQKETMVRLVQCVREGAVDRALTNPPSTRSTHAVPHPRYREEAIKLIQTACPCKPSGVSVPDRNKAPGFRERGDYPT